MVIHDCKATQMNASRRVPMNEGRGLLLMLFLFLNVPIAGFAQLSMSVGIPDISEYPTIHLGVTVRDASGMFTNLFPSNFNLRENSAQMLPLQLDCQTKDNTPPLSVCIVLDVSTSMSFFEDPLKQFYDKDSLKWKTAKTDVALTFQSLRTQDWAAFATFSTIWRTWQNFTTDKKLCLDAVAGLGLKIGSGTYLYDALWNADTLIRKRPPKRVVILLTDGEDQGSLRTQQSVIGTLTRDTVRVYSIGLGVTIKGATALQQISDATGGKCYLAPTVVQLPEIINQIIESIYSATCTLTYTSTDTCHTGSIRAVDVNVTANGNSASASTQYALPDYRSRLSISLSLPDSLLSSSQSEFPVLISGEVRANEAISFSLSVKYDPSVFLFSAFRANPALFSPGPVASVQTPGTLGISSAAAAVLKPLPYGVSDTLGWISFDVLHPEIGVITQVSLNVESISQNCVSIATGGSAQTTVYNCPALLKVDISPPYVFESGTFFWLPLRLVYALDLRQTLSYSFSLRYDTTYLHYLSLRKQNTVSENLNVQVTDAIAGMLQVDAPAGIPHDTSGVLLLLGFESVRQKETRITPISFLNPSMAQPCLPAVQFDDAVIALDGVCTPLVVKKNTFALQQNHPNPVSSDQAQTTNIEFSVSGSGRVTLEVYDVNGRRVAGLVDADLPAGTHSVSFSPAQLPKGVYSYILREGASMAVRKLIWLQ
jgi:hypothetical protein